MSRSRWSRASRAPPRPTATTESFLKSDRASARGSRADTGRREHHPRATAEQREKQTFEEELTLDDARGRAERLSDADLARALLHRNQHDVHDADAAERERHDADDHEELLHVADHAREHERLERRVPHRDRLLVVRIEAVAARQNRADVLFERPVDVLDAAGPLV